MPPPTNVFDPPRCPGLTPVPKIPDDDILPDHNIPNPPNVIKGCRFVPAPVIPDLPPPPPSDGGGGGECPTLLPASQSEPIPFANTNVGTLNYGFQLGQDCTWTLDIDVVAPCPNLQPTSTTTKPIPWVNPSTPSELYYNFTKSANCTWTLDINAQIECPTLLPESETKTVAFVNSPTGALNYGFTLNSLCTWDLDIHLSAPCPTITPESETKTFFFNNVDIGLLDYGFTLSDNCSYALDIDISAPCPTIGPTTNSKTITWSTNNTGQISYGFTKGDNCSYDLDINVYAPCPTLTPSSTSESVYFTNSNIGSLTYGFTLSSNCTWNLDIDLLSPCPQLLPTTTVQKPIVWSANNQGYLSYNFTLGANCTWTLNIDAIAPCPLLLPSSHSENVTFAVGNVGTLEYGFLPSQNCTWLLDMNLWAPCPDIGPTTQTTKYVTFLGKDAGAGLGSYYYQFTKNNTGGACAYDLTLSTIQIPCPVFQQEVVNSVVAYDPCNVPPSLNISVNFNNDDPNNCGTFEWFYTLRIPEPDDCCIKCLERLCVVKDSNGNVKDIYYQHYNPNIGLVKIPICGNGDGGGGGSGGDGGGGGNNQCCDHTPGTSYTATFDIMWNEMPYTGTISTIADTDSVVFYGPLDGPPCDFDVTALGALPLSITCVDGNVDIVLDLYCIGPVCELGTDDFDINITGCPNNPTYNLTIKPGRCASGTIVVAPS